MVQSLLHDPLDADPVDVFHGEVLDAQVLEDEAEGKWTTVSELSIRCHLIRFSKEKYIWVWLITA